MHESGCECTECIMEETSPCMVDECPKHSTHTLQWGILRMRYCPEHYVSKKASRDAGMNVPSTHAKR